MSHTSEHSQHTHTHTHTHILRALNILVTYTHTLECSYHTQTLGSLFLSHINSAPWNPSDTYVPLNSRTETHTDTFHTHTPLKLIAEYTCVFLHILITHRPLKIHFTCCSLFRSFTYCSQIHSLLFPCSALLCSVVCVCACVCVCVCVCVEGHADP